METKRVGGWCLVGSAAVIALAMAHHPTGMREGGLGQFVHGALIIMIFVSAFGFAAFVADRGAGRALMLAGAIPYAVAMLANIGAGSINGFAAPALAASPIEVGPDVMRLAWELNQALAGLAVFATGAAFLFWALDIIRRERLWPRLVGAAGLIAALLPPALLLTGALRMDVTGAFLIYAVQAGWTALVGLLMLGESAPVRRN